MDHRRARQRQRTRACQEKNPHSNHISHVKQHIKSVSQSTPLATSSRS
jgi:hypothetical protein